MDHIYISRTDSIGDVVLTLPLAGFFKSRFPGIKVSFIGRSYTQQVIERSEYVDEFLDRDNLKEIKIPQSENAILFIFPNKEVARWAKKNKIKNRVGTSHRWIHYLYANKRVNFSRKNSDQHESFLNFVLLKGLGIDYTPNESDIQKWYGFQKSNGIHPGPDSQKINIILHPKSKGSAREWPISKYKELIQRMGNEAVLFHITGTKVERGLIQKEDEEFLKLENVSDKTGKMSLDELMDFISVSDGLIAASTGPLHIAAAYGIPCLGLYPSRRPMHPGRWAPIGKQASFLEDGTSLESGPLEIDPTLVENWIRKTILKQ